MNDGVKQEVSQPTEQVESLTLTDKLQVELAKTQRQLALANAKAALSEQEKVELQYKMLVQNLFNRYGLGPQDSISEDGTIMRGSVTEK